MKVKIKDFIIYPQDEWVSYMDFILMNNKKRRFIFIYKITKKRRKTVLRFFELKENCIFELKRFETEISVPRVWHPKSIIGYLITELK